MSKKISQIEQNTVNENNTINVIDLDLSVTQKKRFRFDKDNNRILELNVSDMNIISRVSETYSKLQDLQTKASKLMDGIDVEDESKSVEEMAVVSERLKEVDNEMRDLIDYMFNANVSEVAAPDGSMYDPFEGSFRYEHIITLLMSQYESNLQSEFTKMQRQLEKHTAKYTKGK